MNRRIRVFELLFILCICVSSGRTLAASRDAQEISLDIQNAEISSFFQIIADVSSLNVVLDPEVSGRVTLRLHDVPWTQVLDNVLKMQGLSKRQVGSVLYVFPLGKTSQYFND